MEPQKDIKKLAEDFAKGLEWIEIREVPATLFQDGQLVATGQVALEKYRATFLPRNPERLASVLRPPITLTVTHTNFLLRLKHSSDNLKNDTDKRWSFEIVGFERVA